MDYRIKISTLIDLINPLPEEQVAAMLSKQYERLSDDIHPGDDGSVVALRNVAFHYSDKTTAQKAFKVVKNGMAKMKGDHYIALEIADEDDYSELDNHIIDSTRIN